MKKVLTLLTAVLCLTVSNAQQVHQKDPYLKTFIQDSKRLPNLQLQGQLRDAQAWESFRETNGNWWVEFKEETATPHRAFGAPIATSGVTAPERALNFIANDLQAYGINTADLRLIQNHTSAKYHYVTFIQQYNGLDILWSEATVRINMNNQVCMFGMDIYNNIEMNTIPSISAEGIKPYAAADFGIVVNSVDVVAIPKILPVPGPDGLTYKLVYEATVNTMNANEIPGKYYSLIDANDGTVYYRSNQVHECGEYMMASDVQVNSDITDNPLNPIVNRGLPYLRVEIDGDYYYTDQDGHLILNFITVPTPATIDLYGLYAKVAEGFDTTNIESIDVTVFPGDNFFEFDDASGALPSEVSTYYWQNIVHDHMKSYFPTFEGLDFPQTIRVERTDGSCNAFYDGTSTNFYQEGGGCPSTGLFSDVVMHEYGHGINYDLYTFLGDPLGMNNGGMQEGYADIWGYTVTDYPILAQGFSGGAGTFIRRYDVEPKIYPQDLMGEPHADGEIIAGAWWDVNENLGFDINAMTSIWMESLNGTSDGPNGSEGTIYTDVLIEALIADDDNGDLTDGTPNYEAITSAFCEHGITMMGQVSIDHDGIFTYVSPDVPFSIEMEVDIDYPTYISGFQLMYKINNEPTWNTSAMTDIGGGLFKADITSQPAGTLISYYTELTDVNGCGNVVSPFEANTADPNVPYFAYVGYYKNHLQDFDNVFGSWEVDPFDDDNASTGEWDVNTPIPSNDEFGNSIQTGTDHTDGPGNLCAFTGNAGGGDAIGTNDVDNGKTTLRSPYFDLTVYDNPIVNYYRKYTNDSPTSANPGNDVWQVYISNDEGDTWVKVERTYTSDNTWRRNAIRVKDYVELSNKVGFIFIAQDSIIPSDPTGFNGGSIVEAAIDDLEIWDTKQVYNEIPVVAEFQFDVFPNPANELVNVYFGNITGDVNLVLTNTIGEIVLTDKFNVTNGSQYTIATTKLAQGVYTLTISNDGTVANKQIIIQH